MDFSSDTIIALVSALAAAGSFIAFALPFLKSAEKKERYKSVIEKRRKDLMQQTREEMANRGKQQTVSARESVATVFKVQKMLGAMGEKARTLMLQAGIRNPSAPFKFILARFLLPVFLCLFAMFIIAKRDAGMPDDAAHMSNAMKMLWMMLAALIGYKLPGLLIKNQIQKRTQEIGITFPDALDMMLICVQGGIGLEQTVDRIAEEMAEHSEILAEELGILSAEMAMLSDRRMALQDFARRVGSPSARSFATALIQAEQYGTSVTNAMRIMSEELREQRMALAEQKAASLPPKLTVPMIAFFLPVLFIVILGPAVLKFVQSRHK